MTQAIQTPNFDLAVYGNRGCQGLPASSFPDPAKVLPNKKFLTDLRGGTYSASGTVSRGSFVHGSKPVASAVCFSECVLPLKVLSSLDTLSSTKGSTNSHRTSGSVSSQSSGSSGAAQERRDTNRTDSVASRTHEDHELSADSTALVLQNISQSYTRPMLMAEFADAAWGARDFTCVVLPLDKRTGLNLGYCVIDFVSLSVAAAFAAAFNGRDMRLPSPIGAPETVVASSQDLEDAANFISSIGRQKKRHSFCPNCGGAAEGLSFCRWCGQPSQ
mmetsp:Transcript_8185/g.17877  ORF Transcript_8185/g.17877 Transcript_8185/m.17877 type:complete len:274 (+) Transcript_8185:87-908(+)